MGNGYGALIHAPIGNEYNVQSTVRSFTLPSQIKLIAQRKRGIRLSQLKRVNGKQTKPALSVQTDGLSQLAIRL